MKPLKSLKPSVVFFKCISRTNWIIVFLLFFLIKNGMGQKLNDNLTFTPKGSKKLYDATQTIVAPNVRYSEPEKKQLKKLLLERVEETLFNLEDDSTGLANDYISIWGKPFLTAYKSELQSLQKYLKGQHSAAIFHYVPSPSEIENILKELVVTVEKESDTGDGKFIKFNVIKTNLLKKLLLQHYNLSLSLDTTLRNKGMDITYIKSWRKIEKGYIDLQNLYNKVLLTNSDFFLHKPKIDSLTKEFTSIKSYLFRE